MPVDLPALSEDKRVRDLREKIEAASQRAREAEAVASGVKSRMEQARVRLGAATAAGLLGERPDENPEAIRAEIERLEEKQAEAEAEAEEARAVVTALRDRAPEIFREVHDRMKREAFAQFADVLEEAADALEAALDPVAAVQSAVRENRGWLAIAGDQMGVSPWLTRDRKHAGSCARRWIQDARKRARRLRQNPGFGTRYDRNDFQI